MNEDVITVDVDTVDGQVSITVTEDQLIELMLKIHQLIGIPDLDPTLPDVR